MILTAGVAANGVPANGQLLEVGTNVALFSLLESSYGGDGRTTFALPNLAHAAPSGLTYSICTKGYFPEVQSRAGSSRAQRPKRPSAGDPTFGVDTQRAVAGIGRPCDLGEVILSAGRTANGIPANGQVLDIDSNRALFGQLGTKFGGDGRSSFRVPDLRLAAPSGLTYSICADGVAPERASGTAFNLMTEPASGKLAEDDPRFGVNTQTAVAGRRTVAATVGQVTLTAGSIAHGIPANGQLIELRERRDLHELFSVIGYMYGGEDQFTFRLPDLGRAAPSGLTYAVVASGIYPRPY